MTVTISKIAPSERVNFNIPQLLIMHLNNQKIIILNSGQHGSGNLENCFEGCVVYSDCQQYKIGQIESNFAKNLVSKIHTPMSLTFTP